MMCFFLVFQSNLGKILPRKPSFVVMDLKIRVPMNVVATDLICSLRLLAMWLPHEVVVSLVVADLDCCPFLFLVYTNSWMNFIAADLDRWPLEHPAGLQWAPQR